MYCLICGSIVVYSMEFEFFKCTMTDCPYKTEESSREDKILLSKLVGRMNLNYKVKKFMGD